MRINNDDNVNKLHMSATKQKVTNLCVFIINIYLYIIESGNVKDVCVCLFETPLTDME